MAAIRHMTTHSLNALKGWPSQTAVDFSTDFEASALATVAPDPVWAGSCCSLSSGGKLQLGCEHSGGLIMMPIWTFHNSDDPDVRNDGGITGDSTAVTGDDPEGWAAVKRNNMLGFPAAGAYELETTEYIAGSYPPNTPLQAATSDKGKMKAGTPGTDHIVGVVSRGVKKSADGLKYAANNGVLANGRSVLAFWPFVFPHA